jgi:hypothetical protein
MPLLFYDVLSIMIDIPILPYEAGTPGVFSVKYAGPGGRSFSRPKHYPKSIYNSAESCEFFYECAGMEIAERRAEIALNKMQGARASLFTRMQTMVSPPHDKPKKPWWKLW